MHSISDEEIADLTEDEKHLLYLDMSEEELSEKYEEVRGVYLATRDAVKTACLEKDTERYQKDVLTSQLHYLSRKTSTQTLAVLHDMLSRMFFVLYGEEPDHDRAMEEFDDFWGEEIIFLLDQEEEARNELDVITTIIKSKNNPLQFSALEKIFGDLLALEEEEEDEEEEEEEKSVLSLTDRIEAAVLEEEQGGVVAVEEQEEEVEEVEENTKQGDDEDEESSEEEPEEAT